MCPFLKYESQDETSNWVGWDNLVKLIDSFHKFHLKNQKTQIFLFIC